MQLLRLHTATNKLIFSIICLLNFTLSFDGVSQSYTNFHNEVDANKKAIIGLELSDNYLLNNLDSALYVAILLSAEDNELCRTVSKEIYGSYLMRIGRTEDAIQYLEWALTKYKTWSDWKNASETLNELGNCYLLLGRYSDSKSSYTSSITMGSRSFDETADYNGFLGLGRVLILMNDSVAGINFIQRYKMRALQDSKWEAVSNAYALLAQVEDERNRSLAHEYYLKSAEFGAKSKSQTFQSNVLTNRAILSLDNGDIDNARTEFLRALALRENVKNAKLIVDALYNLGSFEYAVGNSDKAISYFNKSIDLSRDCGFVNDELMAIEFLFSQLNYSSDELENRKEVLQSNLMLSKAGFDMLINEGEPKVPEAKSKVSTLNYLLIVTVIIVVSLVGIAVKN